MTVLVTKITPNMKKREGYIASPSDDDAECTDLTFSTFDVYIFSKCIKSTDPNFNQWVCYWEETNEAVVCDVITQKLSTGYVRVTLLTKKEVPLDTLGSFSRSKNVQYLYNIDGVLMDSKSAASSVVNSTLKSVNTKTHSVQTAQPSHVQPRPKSKSIQDYTQEEIEEYKKKIFG